ncbi:MAG TPA: hypothetical protein DCF45_02500 [Gammaproteobacteria bacterium]|nr:hypothetical protein [Gammaproteobacteria bacterium]
MFTNVKQHFATLLSQVRDSEAADSEHGIELCLAALMVEVARTDLDVKEVELSEINRLLQARFTLTPEELADLLSLATDKADHATSLFEFTTQLKEVVPHERRGELIELLWRVAAADKIIDKYEEQLIRKVAELLHVRHADFIEAKHRALKGHSE